MRLLTALVVLVGGTVAMTGCAQHQPNHAESPSVTIATAKRTTQDEVQRVLDLAPTALVDGLDQSGTGSLVSCAEGKQWAGHATIALQPGADAAEVIDGIQDAAEGEGWKASRDTTGQGKSRLTLHTDAGVSLLIRPDAAASVNIASFSKCFAVPDNFIPARSY
jgi:hypothetical protein